MSKWFITGGNGFIGTNLVAFLSSPTNFVKQKVNEITIYDSKPATETGHLNDINQVAKLHTSAPKITCITGDILDRVSLKEAMNGADYIVHLAASSDVSVSVGDPFFDLQNNVVGTLNTLQAAREIGAKRLVFASSSAPLANAKSPIHEEMAANLGNPYAAGKLAGEAYCKAFSECYGLETVVLRFANVFGPYSDRASGVIPSFIRKAIAEKSIEIYGDGSATRDFIHVSDICFIIAKAAIDARPSKGEIFHVATKTETSIVKIASLVADAMRARGLNPPRFDFKPERIGDIPHCFSENIKARDYFSWEPRNQLQKDIDDLASWFLELQKAGRLEI